MAPGAVESRGRFQHPGERFQRGFCRAVHLPDRRIIDESGSDRSRRRSQGACPARRGAQS
ncbi:hypothetical protein ACFFX0_33240 [Citricoccus parietis]|uniref:Uncharacterized protein n=1 Tax=Citricoccus parietis TaxID=592307 RepID=A0ABV5G9Z6_9MICC